MKRESLYNIERSLIKRYRKDIWIRFIRGITEYELINDGDRIAVAISGGKDSLILAKLLQELSKHNNQNFQLEFIAMDPGYNEEVRRNLEDICEYLEIPVHIYETNIFDVADKMGKGNPCYLCARMRRGSLYDKAQELACNKLALGHHFNDVIETTLLNIFYSANIGTMLPKVRAQNFDNMELIRPLYKVREKDIIRWKNYSGIDALDCACIIGEKRISGKRKEMKDLIEELKENHEDVEISIFRAMENINLDNSIAWEKDKKKYSFLDDY